MSIEMPTAPDAPETIFNTVTMGRVSIDVSGNSNINLSDAQAMHRWIEFTGTLTGNIDVIFPQQEGKDWIVENNEDSATYTLTCKKTAGTGFALTAGKKRYAGYDGTDIVALTAEI